MISLVSVHPPAGRAPCKTVKITSTFEDNLTLKVDCQQVMVVFVSAAACSNGYICSSLKSRVYFFLELYQDRSTQRIDMVDNDFVS